VRVMEKHAWKVHIVARCSDCGWETQNFKNGQALAAIHAKKYKHTVCGEVGIAFRYEGSK
jgi:hypothetical protein